MRSRTIDKVITHNFSILKKNNYSRTSITSREAIISGKDYYQIAGYIMRKIYFIMLDLSAVWQAPNSFQNLGCNGHNSFESRSKSSYI